MPLNCSVDANNCVDCPAMPAVPASTGRVDLAPRVGWDAGANSVAAIAGDCHAVFTVPGNVAGVVIGLRAERDAATDPTRQGHALYFRVVEGIDFVSVYRLGEQVSSTIQRAADDEFEIRRVRSAVTFWRRRASSGARELLYASPDRLGDRLVVTANLYASGDGVR